MTREAAPGWERLLGRDVDGVVDLQRRRLGPLVRTRPPTILRGLRLRLRFQQRRPQLRLGLVPLEAGNLILERLRLLLMARRQLANERLQRR